MNLNRNLVIAAFVLLLLSVFSYWKSVARAERFERGQKFLTQLNPDSIQEIEITKGDDVVTLRKSEDSFLVSEKHNYPAKNESVNRFVNDVLNITLEKAVGSGEKLEKELELVAGEEKTTTVVLRGDKGKEMVTFMVGKSAEDGRGSYIKRVNGDDKNLYLTSKGLFLSTGSDTFLKKDLLDVKSENIQSIRGAGYNFEDGEGGLKLLKLPAGKKESSAAGDVKNMLSSLRFDKVFRADDVEVAGLAFDKSVSVVLKDGSSYDATLASKGEKYFLRISGKFDMQILEDSSRITREESEEELKVKSETLTRNDEIIKFNSFHKPWIYELSEYTAKKFLKTAKELIEDEKKAEDKG